MYKSTVIPEKESEFIWPPFVNTSDSGSFTDNLKFKVDWLIVPETNLDSTSKSKRLGSAEKSKAEKPFKLVIDSS